MSSFLIIPLESGSNKLLCSPMYAARTRTCRAHYDIVWNIVTSSQKMRYYINKICRDNYPVEVSGINASPPHNQWQILQYIMGENRLRPGIVWDIFFIWPIVAQRLVPFMPCLQNFQHMLLAFTLHTPHNSHILSPIPATMPHILDTIPLQYPQYSHVNQNTVSYDIPK